MRGGKKKKKPLGNKNTYVLWKFREVRISELEMSWVHLGHLPKRANLWLCSNEKLYLSSKQKPKSQLKLVDQS